MLVCHVSLSVCLSLSVCVSASVRRDADDLLLSPFSPSLKVGLNVAWLCPLLCRCLMGAHMYFYVCVCWTRSCEVHMQGANGCMVVWMVECCRCLLPCGSVHVPTTPLSLLCANTFALCVCMCVC